MDTIEHPAWFFSDDSEKSKEARELLESSKLPFVEIEEGVDYEVYPEDPIFAPTIMGAYGQFMGIKAVKRYIGLWEDDPRRRK